MYNNNSNDQFTSNSDVHMAHLRDIIKKISPLEWQAFESIVASGVSEEKDAKEVFIQALIDKDKPCKSEDTAWRTVKSLIKIGLFDMEKMHTGYRNFNILKLTPLGVRIYRENFRKEPPTQEHVILKAENSSLQHGYMIKDTATILAKKGVYKEISTSRKRNRIVLSDGSAVIPDVIAFRPDGYYDCFEVECGNHNQQDFNAKCNKLVAFRNIIIIGQNRDSVTKKLKVQIDNWIKAKGRRVLAMSGVKVYLYSLTDFAKGQVTYYYNMTSDEPVCCFKKVRKEGEGNEG